MRLSEAPSHGQPIIIYDAKSRGAEVYLEMAREVIKMAKGLGRGIGALFPGESIEQSGQVEEIQLELIIANPFQPRKIFDEETLQELADSIQEHGILQPIAVRKKDVNMKSLPENADIERLN